MKTILKNILSLASISMIYILTAIFITSDHKWLLLIMQFAIVILAFPFKKYGNLPKLLTSIIVFIALIILGMVIEKDISRGGLYPLFLLLAYYLAKQAFKKKWLWFIIPVIIILNSFVFFPNYFEWIQGYNSPKSIGVDISKLNLIDSNGEKANLPRQGIIVLDFWTTSCAQCFKKFPKFESLSNKYKDRNDIVFYAINVPTKKDKTLDQIVKKIERYNYKFNKLYAIDQSQTEKLLNFNLYPRTFIIKDGKVFNTKQKLNSSNIVINNLEY
ncbi:MAG: TlpA family protein disulfide reductase, partial [Confluentibacter sp.]|nr:TlpA family protein disulfide reductase [Confluentibacter sp.]